MPKWLKVIIGLLLLPACVGAASTLVRVVAHSGRADTIWIALLAGAGCWLAIFFLLPRPMRIYVFGHELTHAVWTWLFGGSVKKFKITRDGGYVVVTKSNFLIALAPYFFPVYVALVIATFAVGHVLWNWKNYIVVCHLFIGAAYAFHITLTFHILRTRQSDITSQGYLFSAVVIFLGNILVLLIGLPLLTSEVSLGWVIHAWWADSVAVIRALFPVP